MYSAGRRRGKSGKQQKRSPPKPQQNVQRNGAIRQYFPDSRDPSPAPKMAAATRTNEPVSTPQHYSLTPSMAPSSSNKEMTIPSLFREDLQDTQGPHTTPLTLHADEELRALLRALPTRADFESLASRLEAAHRKDIAAVRTDINSLSDRMNAGETTVTDLALRVKQIEDTQATQTKLVLTQQLHLEEIEDRSRRNNLRIRGLPEATGTEDLSATATAIFREIASTDFPATLSFDRIHRALGPKSTDPNRPRDVICRIHQYTHKEIILRKAWEMRDVEFDGANLQIMPDLSRATLQRRAMLKPVLELAQHAGITYRWGYPISVTFKKRSQFFTLRSPMELPALFDFLETDPVTVPDWLQLLPRFTQRGGGSGLRRPGSPRPQRSRRRSRITPPEEDREA